MWACSTLWEFKKCEENKRCCLFFFVLIKLMCFINFLVFFLIMLATTYKVNKETSKTFWDILQVPVIIKKIKQWKTKKHAISARSQSIHDFLICSDFKNEKTDNKYKNSHDFFTVNYTVSIIDLQQLQMSTV